MTGYHPSPGTPGLLHRNVCPAPGLLHNRKCPGAGPIKDDVPGAGHLHQLVFKHENCEHSYLGLKIKLSKCPIGPGKVQKTQSTVSNCLFALSPSTNPVTNVLRTDLGLSIPPKFFFESFIDKYVSIFVGSTIH